MIWSFSNRDTHRTCPAWWAGYYGVGYENRPKSTTSDAAEFGSAVHDLIAKLLVWILTAPKVKHADVLAWLESQVDDIDDRDGIITSLKQGAVWAILEAMPLIKAEAKAAKAADGCTVEAPMYFAEDWTPLKGTKRTQTRKLRPLDVNGWGGDADLAYWSRDEGVIVDWKTGRHYPKPDQIKDYAAYMALLEPHVVRWTGKLIWTTEGKVNEYHWTAAELAEHRCAIMEEAAAILGAEDYPTNPGKPQCNWCPLTDCEDRLP